MDRMEEAGPSKVNGSRGVSASSSVLRRQHARLAPCLCFAMIYFCPNEVPRSLRADHPASRCDDRAAPTQRYSIDGAESPCSYTPTLDRVSAASLFPSTEQWRALVQCS
jgi:hypothetical protein